MTTLSGSDYQAEDYRQNHNSSETGTLRTPTGVVELRVHGVAGGTASQNLGDPHPIKISGDSEAGVYRRRQELNTGPDRTVEAYNWSSINSGKTARAFWIVLLPFAAANFAGWLLPDTMRDPRGMPGRDMGSIGSYISPRNNRMWAQACVRIVSLAVTVIVVLGVAAVSMDIIGLQCGIRGACSQPWWFGWFEAVRESPIFDGQPTRFVIVGALVPLAVLGILWLLGKRSATYDRYGTDHEEERDDPEGAYVDTIRLSTLDFWQSPDTTYVQGWLHASVALSALAAVLAASLVQLGQGSNLRPIFYTVGTLAGIWLAVLSMLVILVGWMQQTPRRWLRRSTHSALKPRLTWIPAAVPSGLLLLAAILGWTVAGSLPSDTFVLEPIRNGLIWTTILGLLVLLVLGLLVGAWRVILFSLAIGGLWYVLLGSAGDPGGRIGEAPFLVDIGDSRQWVLVELVLAVLFILSVIRSLRTPPKTADPTRRNGLLEIVASSGVLVGLAIGADARALGDAWWVVGLASGAITVAFLFAAFSLRAHAGRTAREIDAPEAGRMRSGTAFVLAAIALTAVLAMMASLIIWVARALGEGIPHSGDVDVSYEQVAYAAEAGWFALAAVLGIVVLVGLLVIRLGSLRLFRWTGDTALAICQRYDKIAPPPYSDNPDPCKPPGHQGWRLELAESSRTLRLWANVIDEVDWIATAAVMTTLAVVTASVIARVRGNLPGGRIVDAVSIATWVLALLTIVLFFLVRSARDDRQLRATVGILWEVMSFFPRRFHPLAPPCYSERTVIELRNRLVEYTKADSERGKILLAHSQGTMLTTAALLTLNGPKPTRASPKLRVPDGRELDNLAFVTYGCMLERLFRRAWPDQLQRKDLVSLKARLEGKAVQEPASRRDDPHPYPVPTGRPRWMNFGRYTDYLGGRVFAPLQQKPTPTAAEVDIDIRKDDVMFQDPTRRWRFIGETTGPRTWLHSFNYESDTEDSRFRSHVWKWAQTFGRPVAGSADPPAAPGGDR